jgi:DeoR/GlpR family transcriptional regulator of sugar metabolism
MAMQAHERRELILAELLSGNGHVLDLSRRLGVSPSTIRRDLDALKVTGRVTRTYGGAMLGVPQVEPTLQQKGLSLPRQKDAIGGLAATLVADAETIILDAGTTTGWLAWHLRDRRGLRVITNGVNTLLTLHEAADIEVVVLGGELRHINQAICGSMAEENLRQVSADKAFLGADGVTAHRGISSRNMALNYLKKRMVEQADELFVLADHSKLGSRPFPFWTEFDRPYTLITDSNATAEQLEEFHAAPLATVMIADPVPQPREMPARPLASATPDTL